MPIFSQHANVYHTTKGTPYLRDPGVVLFAQTSVDVEQIKPFLEGFDLQFGEYVEDVPIDAGAQVCKIAGQLCYMSFGPKRTTNKNADAYFENIKRSKHGSVLEHATYTFLFYGIGRDVTHELVRHRAGFGFSQISQRYVAGPVLRFVERPDQAADKLLHFYFMNRIDLIVAEYDKVTERLLELQKEEDISGLSKTDLRKQVRQSSRSCLPNETEAPIVVTANARAWRHFIEMRANPHADVMIRRLASLVCKILQSNSPLIFGDYVLEEDKNGLLVASTEFRKV